MNGTGSKEEGVKMEDTNETVVLMWGYLPGASPDRSQLLSPETVWFPPTNIAGDSWKDACGGGCGFAMAISDAGALGTFGWGLHGQCVLLIQRGQGNTNEVLRPPCVSSLLGTQIEGIAAGLWHTICISVEGQRHAFGGNQFSKLGTGTDQSENLPKLLDDDPSLKNKHAKLYLVELVIVPYYDSTSSWPGQFN
ncbi:unnamed protein product [Camellia sinensis]